MIAGHGRHIFKKELNISNTPGILNKNLNTFFKEINWVQCVFIETLLFNLSIATWNVDLLLIH